jgi:hypothetical protein
VLKLAPIAEYLLFPAALSVFGHEYRSADSPRQSLGWLKVAQPYRPSIVLASDRPPSVAYPFSLDRGGLLRASRAGDGYRGEIGCLAGAGSHVADGVACHPRPGCRLSIAVAMATVLGALMGR